MKPAREYTIVLFVLLGLLAAPGLGFSLRAFGRVDVGGVRVPTRPLFGLERAEFGLQIAEAPADLLDFTDQLFDSFV